MPACPVCFGLGFFDLRDFDATLAEMLTDDELALVPRGDPIVGCDECESTGVVSPERLAEIRAASYARVMRLLEQLDG